jgi:hypothetical protein
MKPSVDNTKAYKTPYAIVETNRIIAEMLYLDFLAIRVIMRETTSGKLLGNHINEKNVMAKKNSS